MKKFVAGFVCCAVLAASTSVFAEGITKTIDAVFGQVKLVVNGTPVEQETLLYNGTTYVPLRAAAEALGQEVSYDDATKTAYIGEVPAAEAAEAPATTEDAAEEPAAAEPAAVVDAYADFPGVPDFGKYAGIKATDATTEDGVVVYSYNLSGLDEATSEQIGVDYGTALLAAGFEAVEVTETVFSFASAEYVVSITAHDTEDIIYIGIAAITEGE